MSGSLLKFEKRYSVKIGGRRYPVVKIGNQLWMAENLDYKFNVNGSQIPTGQSGNPSTPAAWYYNNAEATYGIDGTYKCGLLYNWYAVNYLEQNKSTLLPGNWHVPSKTEYESLVSTVGSNPGPKLKALDNSVTQGFPSGWNGTDDYGLGILPCGYHYDSFNSIGSWTWEWTSTESGGDAYHLLLGSSLIEVGTSTKGDGYSLRLVKDLT